MPATVATLRTWKELVNSNQRPSAPICLIGQLTNKLAPRCVRYRLCQFRIANHVLHFQRLNANNLVFVYQFAREVVKIVFPAILNLGMNKGDFMFGFLSVSRSKFFTGQPTLKSSKTLGVFSRVPWIAYLCSIVQRSKMIQSNVNAHCFFSFRQRLRLEFTNQRHKPSPSAILANRGRTRLAWEFATPSNVKRFIALGNLQYTFRS